MAEVARILGIEDILDRPVGGLSGGDRQRVALGRAIVREPKAFLMDEPLGALDAEFREHMAEELRALHDRMGATTVYVTHDQLEAMQMGDKIVVMNHGVVEQFGVPQDIYDWPATRFVAEFIGSPPMNFLHFRRQGGQWACDTVSVERRARSIVPRLREGARAATSHWVSGRNMSASDDAAPYRGRGARDRVSRHDPDRDASTRRCGPSRPGSPATRRSPSDETTGLRLRRTDHDPLRPADRARAALRGQRGSAGPWLK